jgi:hypothetical protein
MDYGIKIFINFRINAKVSKRMTDFSHFINYFIL